MLVLCYIGSGGAGGEISPGAKALSHISFTLMMAVAPIRWADQATWPWVVWAWLAMLLFWCVKPLWRWLQRQRAEGWPTVQGRIESVEVKGPARAELAYSYSLEGHYYSGYYQREFGSEEEAWDFVRDLRGRPAFVSYNPRQPAKSLLLEDAVSTLLKARPPAPLRKFQVRAPEVPGWAKPVLWPFLVLSGVGLGLSLWVHLGAVAGRRVAPEAFFRMLQVSIFVVSIPAALVSIKRIGNRRGKDYWKLALRGSPEWMRYVVYGFVGYAMVNAIFLFQAPQGFSAPNPPAVVWRVASGFWMAVYWAALAILYSALVPAGQLKP